MTRPIAVLAAMEQEGRLIEAGLVDRKEQSTGGRRFATGTIAGHAVVTALTGFGKVAAAATVATAIERYRPAAVLFAGVAGGVGQNVRIGDVVVAETLIQHDFDASPLFDRFVIPALGTAAIPADPTITDALVRAAERVRSAQQEGAERSIADGPAAVGLTGLGRHDVARMKVHRGMVASGDQFIGRAEDQEALIRDLPALLAVEMEGAAIAQVCTESAVPFGVFRSISDRADNNADVDFLAFVDSVAAPLTALIVSEFFSAIS